MSTKEQILEKQEQYKAYISEHRANIQIAWENLKAKINKGMYWLSDREIEDIDYLVEQHDLCKFSEEEFEGYRQWFYPAGDDPTNKILFDAAYLHHQNTSPHHYLHWVLRHDSGFTPVDMPLKYVIEMLIDFEAMGMKFNDGAYEYWESHKDTMLMSENTKKLVEHWVLLFKK